ncbi:unnamed protein product [Wickerhamomyces anomalus]
MLIVGLTGGIAAGKSTVSEKLSKEYGLTIIDADLIARQVQQPGQSAYKKIAKYFGPQVEDLFLEDGQLNRPSLAVRYEIFKQIIISYLKLQKLVILDVPLLFEAKLDQICGATIAVVCDEKLQLERLLKRNSYLTEEDAKQRINAQMSNHSRIRKADYIIDNSHTLEALDENIRGVVQRVTPSWIIYLLELFPVFAAFSAFGTFIIRRIHEWDNDSKQE